MSGLALADLSRDEVAGDTQHSEKSVGSGEQFFRHEGRRYGHLLDPRTGRPVEGMLSVTVLAPSAAEADALATAFFVLGVDKSRQYCENHSQVGALRVPEARRGGPRDVVRVGGGWEDAQVEISEP